MYEFIINPNAGNGSGMKIWNKLEYQLKRRCVDYATHLTQQQGDARAISSRLTDKKETAECVIVVVGGDGTLNEVLDGLSLSPAVTLGYIPVGPNDFAKSIRLPRRPLACLNRILKSNHCKMMDYGVVTYGSGTMEHRRFMVSTGIGINAAVCHDVLCSGVKRRFSGFHLEKLSYILAAVKQSIRSKAVKGYLILDGVKRVEFNHLYLVSAHIQPYDVGGFKLAPKASGSDGKLTVCVIHNARKIRLAPILIRSGIGRLGRDRGVRFYDCREVAIHMEQPRPVHVDGESCESQTDLQVRCIERKVRVIV
jgi:Sphingosine kinase and enzymes related to eukaryotic diacylglycerol kinase